MSGSGRAGLEAVIERMEGLRVLVVGDLMLDEYRVGDVARISPEAPVPIVRVREERYELGGAGNVARNLVSLGASAALVGILGPDREGSILRERALASGIPVEGLIESHDRRTTHKLRVVAHAQQMLRLDREDESPLTPDERARVEQAIFERLEACDAVILADYDKGVFAEGVLAHGLGRMLIARGTGARDPGLGGSQARAPALSRRHAREAESRGGLRGGRWTRGRFREPLAAAREAARRARRGGDRRDPGRRGDQRPLRGRTCLRRAGEAARRLRRPGCGRYLDGRARVMSDRRRIAPRGLCRCECRGCRGRFEGGDRRRDPGRAPGAARRGTRPRSSSHLLASEAS